MPASVVRRGRLVKPLCLQLHQLGLFANGRKPEWLHQPDRLALHEALDVLPADQRDVLAESGAVELDQAMPVPILFGRHRAEDLGAGGIARLESLCKLAEDPGILLLERDGQGQNFLLIETLERSQHEPVNPSCGGIVEEVQAVVRTGRGLGVILDAEDRQPLVPQPFEGLVVQVDVAGLDVGGQRGGVDGEAVVLRRDLDLAGPLVADRVIGAAVAELELEGLGAERLAEELVAQADPEDRDAARLGGGPDQRPQGRRRLGAAAGDRPARWR